MRIEICSVLVDDQRKALRFYTEVLGFVKKTDIPVGEFSWLTVVAPDGPQVELLLEPNDNPDGRAYQSALFQQGIPSTTFSVDDLAAEHARMTALGVVFRSAPKSAGPVMMATFEDTCGNLIQLVQKL